jgi:hypothetical protein
MDDLSPDHDERIKDFLARHGGTGSLTPREGKSAGGVEGWSEIYARDGYALWCEWSTFGAQEKMTYSEIAPRA